MIKNDFKNLIISKMTLNYKMHHKYSSLPYRDFNKLAEVKMIPKDNRLSVIKMFI
jgi:hypothetical protein